MKRLQKGDKAPVFKLQNQKGEWVSLSDYKGKVVALAIYVKNGSKGCVMDLEDLQSHLKELNSNNIEVVALTKTKVESQAAFAEKHGFQFPLLADVEGNVIKEYGAFGLKKTSKGMKDGILRTTVTIDEKGVVIQTIFPVDVHNSAQQILEVIQSSK